MKETLLTLSGIWKIAKDPADPVLRDAYRSRIPDGAVCEISVPEHMPHSQWTMQLSYSNVFPGYHGYVWYYKEVPHVPAVSSDERLHLYFERAGYVCRLYVNGKFVGEHRHHEEAFSFDITDFVNPAGTNLIAVQCFEPRNTGKEIDGINLWQIPNSCWANIQAHMQGTEDAFCLECVGGILGAVHLRAVPDVRIEDVWVRAFPDSGDVQITVTAANDSGTAVSREVCIVLSDHKTGAEVGVLRKVCEIPAGRSEIYLCGHIENHQLWDLDTPVLYQASASIDGRGLRTVRFGFRAFRIENGFFFLNGRRIFLKGAHAAISPSYAASMKALGFNLIRTIARAFPEELLDVCDQIGLLVMDAAATGWGMYYHENSRAQIEQYNENMIRSHRNHPSVAAYCLFNELENNEPLFRCGVEALPKLRTIAPDTLFLLHSGRWDRDITLGSASNPGSDKWDTYLGAEGIPDYPNRTLPIPYDGYQDPAMGDIHIYMHVPVSTDVKAHLRQIGHDVRPIFVSESGIASQPDPMGQYLTYCREKLAVAVTTETVKKSWDETENFLDFYDLRDVYPLAWDFTRATERYNGAQRSLLYNLYRANPMINGFSFTSFGVSLEGTFQGNAVIKDSLAYAIQQGHEPLRWSLFTSERTVYADRPFVIEAVLCNEDVLPPGKYAALAYIRGAGGVVWKKQFTADYPAAGYGGLPPLATSVLQEEITLPAGEYVFSARLTEGGAAYDGDLAFTVAAPAQSLTETVHTWGVSDAVCGFLRQSGANVVPFTADAADAALILVGNPADRSPEDALCAAVASGANAVFLDTDFLSENNALLRRIAGDNAGVRFIRGSIYHHDHICVSHPLFDGLQAAGVLEFDKYGALYPTSIYTGVNKPTKTVCAAMRMDTAFSTPGLSVGEYACGAGRYVLNNFRVSEAVGRHPYADKMLANFVEKYGK